MCNHGRPRPINPRLLTPPPLLHFFSFLPTLSSLLHTSVNYLSVTIECSTSDSKPCSLEFQLRPDAHPTSPYPRPLTAPLTMEKPALRSSRKDTVLSRRYIEGLIAEGKHVIIFEGRVLKVDAWIKFHPGGDKSIKHMVGRDATDEINAYVSPRGYLCSS